MALTKPSSNMLTNGSGYTGSYNRGVTGSITRTPAIDEVLMEDVVYAREFVNCDGTDETVRLQNAFNAAKDKRLILPAGEIRFTGPINLDPAANYIVEGQGRDPNGVNGTVLRNIGTSGQIGIACNDGGEVGRDNSRVFKDFSFFGNQLSGDAFQFASAFGFYLENLFVSTHGGHGVYGYRCFSSTIRNCIIVHIGKHCVFFEEIGNAVLLDKVVAIDGSKNGGGFANIRFQGSSSAAAALGVTIISCDWTSPGLLWGGGVDPNAIGLHLTRVWGAVIHGNYAEISPNYVTYIDSTCRAISFVGNYQQDGVCFIESGAQGIIVEANTFQRVGGFTQLLGASSASSNQCRYFGNFGTGGAVINVTP
jgi:hypothetical protein